MIHQVIHGSRMAKVNEINVFYLNLHYVRNANWEVSCFTYIKTCDLDVLSTNFYVELN